jgi:hypothetical protein
MGTLAGMVLGYILRGTKGSEGFPEVLAAASDVRDSAQFQNMVSAAKMHVGHTIRDLTETLARQGSELAERLEGTPAPRPPGPWDEDIPWPRRVPDR